MKKFSHFQGPQLADNTSQLIRGHFGLTQPELAGLLGVSRSTVAMSEQGETGARSLPTAAWQRLMALALAMPVPDGLALVPAVPAIVALLPYQREELELRLRRLQVDEYPLQKQLAQAQTHLAQARLRLQALPALRTAFPVDDERAQRWLTRFGEDAETTLRDEGATPAQLQLRLDVLAFERAGITRLLAEATIP